MESLEVSELGRECIGSLLCGSECMSRNDSLHQFYLFLWLAFSFLSRPTQDTLSAVNNHRQATLYLDVAYAAENGRVHSMFYDADLQQPSLAHNDSLCLPPAPPSPPSNPIIHPSSSSSIIISTIKSLTTAPCPPPPRSLKRTTFQRKDHHSHQNPKTRNLTMLVVRRLKEIMIKENQQPKT